MSDQLQHLQALITAGRADIATGQANVEALLNKIIGEQNTAAAAEAAAASALAAIESLTSEQKAAAESIASAYSLSLQSIEVSQSPYYHPYSAYLASNMPYSPWPDPEHVLCLRTHQYVLHNVYIVMICHLSPQILPARTHL